jgi:cytochrome oxidase Cu insertion factor (SCO1/SenC/PrrC family)
MMPARVAGIGAALTVCAALWAAQAPAQSEVRRAEAARFMNELMSGKAAVGAPFTLTNQHGRRVSLSDFRGKVVLLYFGFTFCPDICPTDLAVIAQTLEALGKSGDQVQPLFVTLDPARDTRELLRGYVEAFHPRIVALSGSEDEIRRVATAYKVFFEKVTPPGSKTYFIDHSAFTFLLDRNGKYVLFFPPGTPLKLMTARMREELAVK